jgi:hypothetical protein
VTPGNVAGDYNGPYWDKRTTSNSSNGSFTAYLDKKFTHPALKVEADGYLPASFTLLPESRTNLDFALEKGEGPTGTVLSPDGKPASGVSISLLCADEHEVRLSADGHLHSFRNKDLIQLTDPDGGFSFRPELGMEKVVVAAKEGFKIATLQEIAAHPKLTLEPWGKVKGVLHRASALGTNETLDLAFQGDSHYFLEIHTQTDDEGRFEFTQVPPGLLQISARNMMGNNSWQNESLEKFTLASGQNLELNIKAAARSTSPSSTRSSPAPTAPPLRKTGPDLTAKVLLPDGKPAADAEAALLIPGEYVALGRGTLRAYNARREELLAHSDTDGRLSLPSFEGATGLVVVHERGYAEISIDSLKQTPQIKLQAWGRIEGILRVGRHLGTNELVTLQQAPMFEKPQPMIDGNDFQARTDNQGRFIFTQVPPGERKIARMIPQGERSWVHSPGTSITVKPGDVTRIEIGGNGRTVIGKLRLSQPNPDVDWRRAHAAIHSPYPSPFPKFTDPQKQSAWIESPEGKDFWKNIRTHPAYPVILASDGSFRVEEVRPGKYEFEVSLLRSDTPQSALDFLGTFKKSIVVPEGKSPDDDSPADLGILESKLEPPPVHF